MSKTTLHSVSVAESPEAEEKSALIPRKKEMSDEAGATVAMPTVAPRDNPAYEGLVRAFNL